MLLSYYFFLIYSYVLKNCEESARQQAILVDPIYHAHNDAKLLLGDQPRPVGLVVLQILEAPLEVCSQLDEVGTLRSPS